MSTMGYHQLQVWGPDLAEYSSLFGLESGFISPPSRWELGRLRGGMSVVGVRVGYCARPIEPKIETNGGDQGRK